MDSSKKDIASFLESLREKNVHLKLNNNNVRIEAAKGTLTPTIVKTIKKRKEEIIQFLKTIQLADQNQQEILVAAAQPSYPLSSNQMGMWLSTQLHETSTAFNMHGRLDLTRSFDPDLLQKAIAQTVERHEILRTVFRKDDMGNARQWILDASKATPELLVLDLRHSTQQEAEVVKHIEADTQTLFDLSGGPLFRVVLFELSNERCILYYNMHHIISDAWSMNVLIQDVLNCYNAMEIGQTLELPPLKIQYKDYAVWQQDQIQSGALKAHKTYWRNQFGGEIPALNLFPNTQRPAVKTTKGRVLSTYIAKDTATAFQQKCKENGGSLFMGLMTAINILIYRYTAQEDIIVGLPISGRNHADLNSQIGFYINTLALRTQFDGENSFNSLFEKVRKNTLDAYQYANYPFNDVLKSLHLERDQSRSPLFDVFVNLQNVEEAAIAQFEEAVALVDQSESDQIIDLGSSNCKFDLVFNFQEINDAIYLALEFNTDIYSAVQVDQFIQHFKNILVSIVENPTAKIGQLAFINSVEYEQVVHKFSQSNSHFAQVQKIIPRLEHWAATQGMETAVTFKNQQISYADFNAQVNQLAHFLLEQGLGREAIVPIYMDRSPAMLITIYAVLKAGLAFLPLDKVYPKERIRHILEEVNAILVITDEVDVQLPAVKQIVRLLPDAVWPEAITQQKTTNPNIVLTPDQLAYLIYTSGSTGRPKGVAIEHQSLDNYLNWVLNEYLPEEDLGNMGWYSSPAFDLSITSIFTSLLKGKTLNIYAQDEELTEVFKDYLSTERQLDLLKLTPAHIDLIAATDIQTTKIPKIIVGGDTLLPRHVEVLQRLNPSVQIYNEYGPTEATVGCTVAMIPLGTKNISIGRAITNTRIYILNEELMPVPVGLTGELYIGGVQVAREYFQQATLTAERFVDDPFQPGNRLYKTGDLGRWLPDGNIEYAGRNDHQVKMRGYRIELNEIEKVLSQFEKVKEVCVLLRTDEVGEKQIIAFYTSEQLKRHNEVIDYLSERLPTYMIPTVFQRLETLPLTENGKVDRKQLIHSEITEDRNEYLAPRNEMEEQLVTIWCEILGLEKIGVTDNFFELGGHSIKAIKILSMVHKQFGVTLGIQKMFENPTVEYLESLIADAKWIAGTLEQKVDDVELEKIKI